MKRVVAVLGLILGSFTSSAQAGSITILYNYGTTNETNGLSAFSVTGAGMDGMLVSATTSVSTTTGVWADTVGECGAATGAGWLVSACGDTGAFLANGWTLSSDAPLLSLLIDAGPGRVVFDAVYYTVRPDGSLDFGTPGSQPGWPFTVGAGGENYDITVTYIDAVALAGQPPAGDTFRYLHLAFAQPFQGRLTFSQDTDSLAPGTDLSPVPEPSSLFLLGTGLCYGARRLRRRA